MTPALVLSDDAGPVRVLTMNRPEARNALSPGLIGTLYAALARMVDQGLIEPVASDDERRRPYRITASGRAHLHEQMTGLNHVVKIALGRLKPA